MINEKENRRVFVMHPEDNVPVWAEKVGYFLQNGRAVGLQLLFPDGRRVGFTYDDIRAMLAQAALDF